MAVTKFPTLAAIAKEAGVSRMTVSRVLRQGRNIAPETKSRVLSAVQKLNYRPNPMVSAMMTYVRSGSVPNNVGVMAYVTSGPARWRSVAPFSGLLQGATKNADRYGYRLEEFTMNDRGMNMTRLGEVLYAQGIAGIIIGPLFVPRGHLQCDWTKFSVVTIGHSLLKPMLDRVSNDQYSSMLLTLRHLRRYGYRRVGLALDSRDDERVHYRWSAGYLSHHQRFYRGKHLPIHQPKSWRWKNFFHWVDRYQPDVIVTTSHDMYAAMQKEGYRFPVDLGFVHLDLPAGNQTMAGINQRTEDVGAAAVDLLAEQINRNFTGTPENPRVVTLQGHWVDGPSIRAH